MFLTVDVVKDQAGLKLAQHWETRRGLSFRRLVLFLWPLNSTQFHPMPVARDLKSAAASERILIVATTRRRPTTTEMLSSP